LADGFHRYFATKANATASIDAEVRTGTLRDAILFSFSANDPSKRGLSPTFDPKTGVESSTDTDYTIKLVVELPRKEQWDYEYDLTYIAVGKNFTYGALFTAADRVIVIDKSSLRHNGAYVDIKESDLIIMDGSDIFAISNLVRLKENLGYILSLKHVNDDSAVQEHGS
jgi:hypothetical protein